MPLVGVASAPRPGPARARQMLRCPRSARQTAHVLGAVAAISLRPIRRPNGSDLPRPTRDDARALRPLQRIGGTLSWLALRGCRIGLTRCDGLASRSLYSPRSLHDHSTDISP